VSGIRLRSATEGDVGSILSFIQALAEYEHLAHECEATEDQLRATLFGAAPAAEVLIAEFDGTPAGFALFFQNYSTFRARPGIYLEDLFVLPAFRSRGIGRALLARIAHLAIERGCARFEWSVLDWNAPAIKVYQAIGARPLSDWTVQRLDGDALQALAAEDRV